MLVFIECEAVSVEGCLRELKEKAKILENMPGSIEKAKIELSFGAFMGIRIALNIDPTKKAEKCIIAEYTSGKDVRERVVYVGRRIDLVEGRDDFSAAVGLGIASNPKLISIIDEEKAGEKLGISLENGLHEKYRSLSKKSSELEQLIYIRGMKTDLLIGDSRWRLSWIDRPLNDAGVNTLIAVTLSLIARSVDRFEAAAAAGYLAGVATKSGYRAALNELNRLMGRS